MSGCLSKIADAFIYVTEIRQTAHEISVAHVSYLLNIGLNLETSRVATQHVPVHFSELARGMVEILPE